MPVTLTNTIVKYITVDYINQVVNVIYVFADASGGEWGDTDTAHFWATMPPEPEGGYPMNWFQLPAGYIPTFLTLQSDAATAITTKFLG